MWDSLDSQAVGTVWCGAKLGSDAAGEPNAATNSGRTGGAAPVPPPPTTAAAATDAATADTAVVTAIAEDADDTDGMQ